MQAKRCDHLFLQVAAKFHGTELVEELQRSPLLRLTKENIREAMLDNSSLLTFDEWKAGIPVERLPFDSLCVYFEQPNDINSAIFAKIDITDINKFQIIYSGGNKESLEKNPTPLIYAKVGVHLNESNRSWNFHVDEIQVFNDSNYIGPSYDSIETIQKQISDTPEHTEWCFHTVIVTVNQIFRFLKHLEVAPLHPVEVKAAPKNGLPPKLGKKQKAEPWRRLDLPTIIYLNKLPTDAPNKSSTEHRNGTGHATTSGTKEPHRRKGHRRTLRHEKYKNHELYMVKDAIPIPPAWVGAKTSNYMGAEYRVLSKIDIFTKMSKKRSSKSNKTS